MKDENYKVVIFFPNESSYLLTVCNFAPNKTRQ
jgi:hypothetical protein